MRYWNRCGDVLFGDWMLSQQQPLVEELGSLVSAIAGWLTPPAIFAATFNSLLRTRQSSYLVNSKHSLATF